MKKIVFYLFAVVITLSIISCGADKKATNFDELKAKYDGKEFKNCDEMIKFGEEYIDVLIATIDKAAEGDEKALADIESMDEFFSQFDAKQKELEEECPEQFEEFGKKAEEKLAPSMDKLMEILFGNMDWDDYEDDFDWDDEDFDWEEEELID